ncbi:ribosome biogenesis regulatory protein homolog [Cylas formicarius]|uniref:ribosome biogenesis regulatory protein homolog n=1 Tax=Cylas formicarius TaxID=197179 RepID=UPI002958B9AD|nr:ribosome biogenesis regulatory protein homolog [Cylas formicarius]
MEIVNGILQKTVPGRPKSITVEKHIDLDYDLGNLLALDANDVTNPLLKSDRNEFFLQLARDNTQLLLNEIWDLPTEKVDEALMVKLPVPKLRLPRMKPIPKPKPLTKWQKFAKEKGITKKKKSKLLWDEQLKKWIPTYGFKRTRAEREKNWVMEVPTNSDPMEDQFSKKMNNKSENVAKNELQRLRNIAKAKKVKVPRVGVLNADVSSAKDLQVAVTVAKASTASLGQFQNKLPKEKEARGVSAITPGASRKRKLAPISAALEKDEQLIIVDSILSKRPKLDVTKVVSKHSPVPRQEMTETSSRPKVEKRKKQSSSKLKKKPKTVRNQRQTRKGGRKRR